MSTSSSSDRRLGASVAIELGAALVSSLELEEALTTIVQKIGEALGASSVALWRCSRDLHQATFEAYWSADGYPPHDAEHVGIVVGLDQRPDLAALVDGREPLEHHVDDPSLPRRIRGFMDQRGYQSLFEAPLIVGDTVLGSLSLAETAAVRRYSAEERDLLAQLCLMAAIGIHNAELYRRMEEQKRRALSLLDSSRSTAVSLGAQHAIETMRSEIVTLLAGIDVDLDVRIDLGGGELERFVAEDPDGGLQMESRLGPPDPVAKRALDEQRPVQQRTGERLRLVVPLELRNGVSGYFDLRSAILRELNDDEVAFVQTLAHHAAASFEQARLARHLANRSFIDPKTGLFTSAFFHDRLFSELARAYRYKESVSLILMSVDDLREYRDETGAPRSDQVMRALGRFLKRALRRRIDMAARSGDDEFALALPNTALAGGGAAKAAERLRSTIQEYNFCDEDDRPLGEITVSQGLACYPNHADDAMDLLAAAEKALQAARTKGRNRIEVSAHS